MFCLFGGGAARGRGRQTMARGWRQNCRTLQEQADELGRYNGYVEGRCLTQAVPYTDEAYRRFWRRCTCTKANVGGQARWWVTAYVYYDNNEVVRMSTLIGP